MRPLIVRRLRAGEASLLRRLRLESLRDSPDSFGETLAEAQAHEDAHWQRLAETCTTRGPHVAFVAESDGAATGLAFGIADGPDAARVGGMWVRSSARERGVGRALLCAVMQWASETGRERVELWAPAHHPVALALYRGAGFRETGDRRVHREGMVIVAMRRQASSER